MKVLSAVILALALLVAACGDDDGTTDAPTTTDAAALTAEERAWCTFLDDSPESIARFDAIFETGLSLGLNMDVVNATASGQRTLYLSQGLSEEDAILAASLDLFEFDAFVIACRETYAEASAG
jgi:hypothetical protein